MYFDRYDTYLQATEKNLLIKLSLRMKQNNLPLLPVMEDCCSDCSEDEN
jgi:hypothetical protein